MVLRLDFGLFFHSSILSRCDNFKFHQYSSFWSLSSLWCSTNETIIVYQLLIMPKPVGFHSTHPCCEVESCPCHQRPRKRPLIKEPPRPSGDPLHLWTEWLTAGWPQHSVLKENKFSLQAERWSHFQIRTSILRSILTGLEAKTVTTSNETRVWTPSSWSEKDDTDWLISISKGLVPGTWTRTFGSRNHFID